MKRFKFPIGIDMHRKILCLATAFMTTVSLTSLGSTVKTPVQNQPQLNLQRIKLNVYQKQLDVQVAKTNQEQAIGLMHRKTLPDNEGMLFAFNSSAIQCFWMKNTLLPLTAVFLDEDGIILNFAKMQPQTLDAHCSIKPASHVLEVNQNWFVENGFSEEELVGSRLDLMALSTTKIKIKNQFRNTPSVN